MRIAIDIDSRLHHHWPLVAAAAKRRFGVDLPYEEQFPAATLRLGEEQLRACIENTHADEAIVAARPYPHAVEAGIRAATLRHPWNQHLCDAPHIACAAGWRELDRVLAPVLDAP